MRHTILEICLKSKNGMLLRENVFKKKYASEYEDIVKICFPENFVFKQKLYHWIHNDDELKLGVCPVCGKRCKFLDIRRGYSSHCSVKCASRSETVKSKTKNTNLEKYGSVCSLHAKGIKEKTKKTMLERYGVEYATQSEAVKQKVKESFMEKYGVEWVSKSEIVKKKKEETCELRYGAKQFFQSDMFKDKSKNSCLSHYGVENPSQSDIIKKKKEETCLKHYGVKNPFQSNEIKQRIKEENIKKYGKEHAQQSVVVKEKIRRTNLEKYGCSSPLKHELFKLKSQETCISKYGVPYNCMRQEARNHSNNSKPNEFFANILDSIGIQYKRELTIHRYSYDFAVGKCLIEINPTITHNSHINIFGGTPHRSSYHLDKSNTAKEHGYHCIHVWDWDDKSKIANMLKAKETLYAGNLELREVSEKECDEFLKLYHLQNTCKGQKIRYGLYKDETLVQVMTFGKPRYNKNYELELLRLCNHKDYEIVGGPERLFKYILDKFKPKNIISYCDNSKFDGEVYKRLGFVVNKKSNPSKHWYSSKSKQHITDSMLNQRGFDKIFNTDYGKGTSNEELMLEHCFLPVYDCGQTIWVFRCDYWDEQLIGI